MLVRAIILIVLCSTLIECNIGVSPCPIFNNNGTVHSGTIIIAGNGIVPLVPGQDSQCYNYSLPYAFLSIPEVAVAVHDFESDPSNNLFYYIKPLQTSSLAFVPFVIRTMWGYTQWSKIAFSFIAEDRHDFQSGYYQIDSGLLAGCSSGKEVRVLLPFRTAFVYGMDIKHLLFLHGFEITTMPFSENRRSPYELQLGSSVANTSGIAVTLSVTTITQVNSIYISYIAYQDTVLRVIHGSYAYDLKTGEGLAHAPLTSVPRNYARLYGISGLIINFNDQSMYFSTLWTGHEFQFGLAASESLVQYLTYEYIFFAGSECEDCPGYPISFNGTCVNACPPNTFITPENVCLSCGEGRYWNGTACAVKCPAGQYMNPTTNQCECPPTLNWNGERCIPCTAGKIFMEQTLSCECPPPLKWNGFACARLPECSNGTEWDVYTYSCVCPEHQFWDTASRHCKDIPTCFGGRILDSRYNCVCPTDYYWNGQRCAYTPCVGGQVWVGSNCTCPSGRHFNGSICIQCINGQEWNSGTKSCQCPTGYEWTGLFCNQTYDCSGNRVWNETVKQCICPSGEYWNGRSCAIQPICHGGQVWNSRTLECLCGAGSKWNTTDCVRCRNGQIWDEPSLTCQCPRGTVLNNGICSVVQECTGGAEWNQNIWQCVCPQNTVYNGYYCINNPCYNGRLWNDTVRACMCPDNKIWDRDACIPPVIACNNGRIWDASVYACVCPRGTFPSISKCDEIPVCTGGQVYNPLNNLCECPYGLLFSNSRCVEPQCPDGQYWDSYRCTAISCPPMTYYEDNKCVYNENQCSTSYYWDGSSCRFYPNICPTGTQWVNQTCVTIGSCQEGSYLNDNGQCVSLSQACPSPLEWVDGKCTVQNGNCPTGTYYSSGMCQPTAGCGNGFVWDTNTLQCVCPAGQQSNGATCIRCPGGKSWVAGVGCRCVGGEFDLGSSCEVINQTRCLSIPNAQWTSNVCQCNAGYSKIGLQCICYGVETGGVCERCSSKPNSVWDEYLCKCVSGYTEINGRCIPDGSGSGSASPSSCGVGSYFDANHRECVACPDGCLSCVDCYTCSQCRPEFNFYNGLCLEKCGDGLRFVSGCDDGNNEDGDGCSRDCYVEAGYTCVGGSPDSKDNCVPFQTQKDYLTITQTGQVRLPSSILINVKLDYLPQNLLYSADCHNKCQNIVVGNIVDGDNGATSITSEYLPGTSFTFSVTVEFGRSYIGPFQIEISIDRAISQKYFGSVSTVSSTLVVDVNPAFLSLVDNDDLYL